MLNVELNASLRIKFSSIFLVHTDVHDREEQKSQRCGSIHSKKKKKSELHTLFFVLFVLSLMQKLNDFLTWSELVDVDVE